MAKLYIMDTLPHLKKRKKEMGKGDHQPNEKR